MRLLVLALSFVVTSSSFAGRPGFTPPPPAPAPMPMSVSTWECGPFKGGKGIMPGAPKVKITEHLETMGPMLPAFKHVYTLWTKATRPGSKEKSYELGYKTRAQMEATREDGTKFQVVFSEDRREAVVRMGGTKGPKAVCQMEKEFGAL